METGRDSSLVEMEVVVVQVVVAAGVGKVAEQVQLPPPVWPLELPPGSPQSASFSANPCRIHHKTSLDTFSSLRPKMVGSSEVECPLV